MCCDRAGAKLAPPARPASRPVTANPTRRERQRGCLQGAVAGVMDGLSCGARLALRSDVMGSRTGAVLMVMLAATACSSSLTPPTCSDGSCGSQTTVSRTFQQSYNRMVDVLFVVDDTQAIALWAENVTAAYPAMASAIERML